MTMRPITEKQRNMVFDFLEASLPLTEEQQAELQRQLHAENSKVCELAEARFAEGVRDGGLAGRDAVQRSLITLGQKRFGSPSSEVKSRVCDISDLAQLRELLGRILDVDSWDDLLQADISHDHVVIASCD